MAPYRIKKCFLLKPFYVFYDDDNGNNTAAVYVEDAWLASHPGTFNKATSGRNTSTGRWATNLTYGGKTYSLVSPATKPLRQMCAALNISTEGKGSCGMSWAIIQSGKVKVNNW